MKMDSVVAYDQAVVAEVPVRLRNCFQGSVTYQLSAFSGLTERNIGVNGF